MLASVRASHAETAELPLELEWSAPPECPTAEQVRAELARVTRTRAGNQKQLRARAEIAKEADEYVLSLTTVRDGERREKLGRAPDCATLQQMATLILGLALGDSVELVLDDSGVAQSPPEPSPAPAPATRREPRAAPAASADSRVSGDPRLDAPAPNGARSRWLAFGGISSNAGLLPELSLGPVAGVGFVPRRRVVPELALSVTALWPLSTTSVQPGVTASFSALLSRGAGCWSSSGSKPDVAVCLLAVSAGAILAGSEGADRDESVVVPFYAWSPSLRVSFDLSSYARLRFEPLAVLSPFQSRFRVAGVGEVHTLPPWSAGAELALELAEVPR